jgi:D-glycero-beta-D-manno-heptose-7-phosphate kinase
MSMLSPDLAAFEAVVARFAGRRVAVLGDCMLDRYLWGRVERISPEAPVPIVEVERESSALGGAGNVAANLRALGAEPLLLGVVGEDDDGRRLREAFAARGLGLGGVVTDATRPTTVKTRIVAHAQQVVRADRESRAELSGAALARLLEVVERELPGCEGLVVSDYGKGVIHPGTLAPALGAAGRAGCAVSVDPKESHIDAYPA